MRLPFGKKKKKDPVLEKIIAEIEANLLRCYKDDAQRKYRKLVSCFEEALSNGKLSEAQQSYYYDQIHNYREKLGLGVKNSDESV